MKCKLLILKKYYRFETFTLFLKLNEEFIVFIINSLKLKLNVIKNVKYNVIIFGLIEKFF